MAVLVPLDWQVSEDVAEAGLQLLADYRTHGPAQTRVSVDISVRTDGVRICLDDDAGWKRELFVIPRRPFRTGARPLPAAPPKT